MRGEERGQRRHRPVHSPAPRRTAPFLAGWDKCCRISIPDPCNPEASAAPFCVIRAFFTTFSRTLGSSRRAWMALTNLWDSFSSCINAESSTKKLKADNTRWSE